jgi:RNA polymerase sigma-70 factor (ECF subfamily)
VGQASEVDDTTRRRAAAGDVGALGALHDALAPDVRRYLAALRLLDSHAQEDALQETFVRLVRLLPAVEPEKRLLPFTLGVARRVALEQARRRKAHGGEAELQRVVAPGPGLPDAAAKAEEQERVVAALADLEPDQRSVVTLRFVSGLVMEELAAAIGCSVPTARARLREASARLVVALEARGLVREAPVVAGGAA